MEFEPSSIESLQSTKPLQPKILRGMDASTKETSFLGTLGMVVSVCSFIMMAAIVFFVVENREKSNYKCY